MRGSANPASVGGTPEYGRGTGIPNPIDVHVGKRIRMRRLLLGMNQETLEVARSRFLEPVPLADGCVEPREVIFVIGDDGEVLGGVWKPAGRVTLVAEYRLGREKSSTMCGCGGSMVMGWKLLWMISDAPGLITGKYID